MSTTVVLDPGSTHDGRKDLCKELIDRCKEIGCQYLKFQLFPNTKEFTSTGNIPLPYEWFGDLVTYGWKKNVQVTASAFDDRALEVVARQKDLPFIKFAYSQKDRLNNIEGLLNRGTKVVVSTDCMNLHKLPVRDNLTTLFCQPVYPTMWQTNFDGLFPPFDGFSDHSLGISESIAAHTFGATWIEKHVTLPYKECKATPDGRFAIDFEQAEQLIKQIKRLDAKNELATDRR